MNLDSHMLSRLAFFWIVLLPLSAQADEYEDLLWGTPKPSSAAPASPRGRSGDRTPGPRDVKEEGVDEPVPNVALELNLRPSYNMWIGGDAGPTELAESYAPGGGAEVNLGIRFARSVVLYGGFGRIAWGVAEDSPFYDTKESSSWEDYYIGGIRLRFGDYVGMLMDLSGGYSKLQQESTDDAGTTGTLHAESAFGRVGAGVSIRPARWVAIEPMLAFRLMGNSGSESTLETKSISLKRGFDPAIGTAFSLEVGGVLALPLSKK